MTAIYVVAAVLMFYAIGLCAERRDHEPPTSEQRGLTFAGKHGRR